MHRAVRFLGRLKRRRYLPQLVPFGMKSDADVSNDLKYVTAVVERKVASLMCETSDVSSVYLHYGVCGLT